MTDKKYEKIVLIILDGWGLSPTWGGNALAINNPKNIDRLWREYPHTVLNALSTIVKNEPICDSRLGHMLIGTGRTVKSNLTRINDSIKNRSFFKNEVLLSAINWADKNNSNLHLVGLASEGGVHAHINHLLALLDLAYLNNFKRVCVDIITDGADTDSTDALRYIEKIQKKLDELKVGVISSIGGRNFAMDRDNNWDKTNTYYKAVMGEKYESYLNPVEAVTRSYKTGINDEYILPGLISQQNNTFLPINKNDAVIFYNYREDRARQLTSLFLKIKHNIFGSNKKTNDLFFATFIDYQKEFPAKIVFPNMIYENSLSEVLSKSNLKQLKIAESEKYAHVTYFLNGGIEEPFLNEDRKIIPSIKTDTFENYPAMSAPQITTNAYQAIKSNKYNLIVINFANVDVLAHTGNIMAVGEAVKVIDSVVDEVVRANLNSGGATIITADHGNAEQMINLNKNYNGDRKTYHTLNPVPFILVTPENHKNFIQSAVSQHSSALSEIMNAENSLADVAPTILQLLQIAKPNEMNGHSLIGRLE